MPILPFDLTGKRVYVAGHGAMAGAAIVRRLAQAGCDLITVGRSDVDLERQAETEGFLADISPDVVIVAAAKVGGIHANSTFPADFISDNIAIARNVIHGAFKSGVQKLLFLASSCIYPRLARQPMAEEDLLTGPLEPTNEWYAVAKIAGIKLCQAYRRQHGVDFVSVTPSNLYGPGDNYDPENGHVIGSLIRRCHQAKVDHLPEVTVWGTGLPRREFLFIDDLADACVFVLQHYSGELHLNIGSGQEVTIADLARLVADTVGYPGRLAFDPSRPDGAPRKWLDVSRLAALGWRTRISLREGLERSYAAFLADQQTAEIPVQRLG